MSYSQACRPFEKVSIGKRRIRKGREEPVGACSQRVRRDLEFAGGFLCHTFEGQVGSTKQGNSQSPILQRKKRE